MLYDILIGVCTGMVTGIISGWIVYILTKRREEEYETYRFWYFYLLDALKYCDLHIPIDALHQIPADVGAESTWSKTFISLYDHIHHAELLDLEASEQDQAIFNDITVLFEELNKWKAKHHIKTKKIKK